MSEKRILSGMRPTGKLHLGHYVGALENWVALQNEKKEDGDLKYKTFFLVADYHTLTTSRVTTNLKKYSFDMVADWVASGIDPEKSPIFRQSKISEHAELFLIFSMMVTTARLERNPSLKEQVRDLDLDSVMFGHLGYPILQAADILLYRANLVPVGEDQLPHVEITREIARKFNQVYGHVFDEPIHKITKFSRLPGLDARSKMSKSLGNTIFLSDSQEDVSSKLKRATTDPEKKRRYDPGNPDICPVYAYHKGFSSADLIEDVTQGCRSGKLGCVECKEKCATTVSEFLSPIIEKRTQLMKNHQYLENILYEGELRAGQVAKSTMEKVKNKLNII